MIIAWIEFLPGIISSIFGGGIVAAIVALYKIKPESGQIVVTAAQGALLVQSGVIENLKQEIDRLNAEIANLKTENESLKQQVTSLLANQNRHEEEIKSLCHKPDQ